MTDPTPSGHTQHALNLLLDALRHGIDHHPNLDPVDKATWLSLIRLVRRQQTQVDITQMDDSERLWFLFDASRQDNPAPQPPGRSGIVSFTDRCVYLPPTPAMRERHQHELDAYHDRQQRAQALHDAIRQSHQKRADNKARRAQKTTPPAPNTTK